MVWGKISKDKISVWYVNLRELPVFSVSLVTVGHIRTKAAKYQISFDPFLGTFSKIFHFYLVQSYQCPFTPNQSHYLLSRLHLLYGLCLRFTIV